MNDVTVVTSVTYPSPESLALVADVQYHEPYLSAALNRKFRGIVDPGFYAGFLPKPGGGMNLLITSVDGDKTAGAASVDIGEFYQVTIQHRKDISLALSAGKKYAIVLKGRYLLGEDTSQVNTASHIHAAEFVARTYTDSYQLGDGELLVCTVNIPAGVSAITQEMIDTSERINRTIGIEISDSVTSTRSDVAASSLAVKKAYDLAKSKYTAQDASTTQKGLVQLSSETNSDSETMAATPKAVKSVKDLADTKAPIESPSLTGTPTAPTAAQGTNSTQIANTAFVKAAITALINGAPGTLDTLKEIAAAINNDPNYSTTINNALALKAPLASPALTGVPTAPTAAQGTNNTQIATTAYVRAAISALVGSSPEALDTLNELAAALGNDPNFATTMTNALAGKQPLDATLTALAGLATGANKLPYFTGTDTVAQTDLTSVGRDILAKTSTLAVIQYLGLRELGTSGEKIPLLSTANTWSERQTFNGGITGSLTGNADTATKLKTARKINNVSFDGSADITLTPANLDVTSLTFMKHNGIIPSGENIDNYGIDEKYLGTWSCPSAKNCRMEWGFPEEGGNGLLEVFNDGRYHCTQRYTTKRGTVYVRMLNNDWDPLAPDWMEWVNVSGSTRPLDSTIDLNTLGGIEHVGTWRNSSKSIAVTGLHYPEEGYYAQGILEISEGGLFGRMQRYTTHTGNMYIRSLSAVWDPENPQWGEWFAVGHQSLQWTYSGNLNDLLVPGIYSCTKSVSNAPILDSDKKAIGSIVEVRKRCDLESYVQTYTTVSETAAYKNRSYQRTRNYNENAWSEWAEIYTSSSSIPGVNTKGNQDTTGNAATATKLKTARKISGVAFDGSADITLKASHVGAFALGKTGDTVANDKAVGWNWSSGAYNATISGASTLILHFYMGEGSCPAAQFRISYKNGGIFYRSARDGYGFEADWSEFYTTTRKPSASDVGAYSKSESDSRYALKTACVTSVRLGAYKTHTMQKGTMFETAGYVITGLGIIGEVDGDDPARLRPLQYCINGTWYTAATA
ncbi:phage tail protein [Salmonella enterica]|nr:phage tail protein [Salmonella enterica]